MEYKLVKLSKFSGNEASVYSIYLKDERRTLFDRFLKENINSFKSELNDIVVRLKTIGHDTGARKQFFKTNEGKPGDGVCAFYDIPKSNLRLYCICYGTLLVVLGGGGYKPKKNEGITGRSETGGGKFFNAPNFKGYSAPDEREG